MEKISPIKANILQLIEFKGITKAEFCKKTGVPYSNFKGKSLESEIGGSMIAQILYTYPDISGDWLLTGNGDILKKKTTVPIEEADSLDYENQMLNQRIEMLEKSIEEKDNIIGLLSSQLDDLRGQFEDQLKSKDAQISSLLNILANKTC